MHYKIYLSITTSCDMNFNIQKFNFMKWYAYFINIDLEKSNIYLYCIIEKWCIQHFWGEHHTIEYL